MQASFAKSDVMRIVARCQEVADKKSTMPALANVLIATDGTDAVRLSATDLSLAVSGRVAAEVAKAGSVAVHAKDLFSRLKMMPEGQLTVTTTDGSNATIKAAGSARRYMLHGIPGDEFPAIPQPDAKAPVLSLPVDSLSSLIARTHFSISTDDTRLHLSSALFEWEGERLRMVSTDGHRLSKMELAAGKAAQASMLIPLKGIQELRRLCDEASPESKDVTLVQSGSSAFFGLSGITLSVKLVDAQFPPYGQVIPKSAERTIVAPRLALADALRAVSIAANERTGGVKLSLTRGTMRFSSESPDSGEGFDEVPIEYEGADMALGLNARYVLDVLAALDEERVVLGISGELDPVTIRSQTTDDYVAVVMPMRV